jgi:O-antigen/teichoic acid export membrane protein
MPHCASTSVRRAPYWPSPRARGRTGAALARGLGVWLVLFTVLLSWSHVLDRLPTVDGWQVGIFMTMSVVRALLTLSVAWLTRSVFAVIVSLIVLDAIKVCILSAYIRRFHPSDEPRWAWPRSKDHAAQAIPFGLGGMLFLFRGRAEKWLVAALFNAAQLAAFSIASVVAPILAVARRSVSMLLLLLPRMSRELSQGNSSTVIQLNNTVNIAVAAVLFPLLSYVLFYAGPLVELVYTSKMIDAAPVTRIMMLACALQVVDLNSLSLLLKQGKFTTALNGGLLAAAMPPSWWGVHHWGLNGALLGSTVAIYAERILLARRLAREMNRPVRQLQPLGAARAVGNGRHGGRRGVALAG